MGMMRIRGVWTVNAAAFLVGAGMYSSFILVPEFTETPASTGYGFGASRHRGRPLPAAVDVAMLIVSPIAGWLADRDRRAPHPDRSAALVDARLLHAAWRVAHDAASSTSTWRRR